jgi:hypothetical protein
MSARTRAFAVILSEVEGYRGTNATPPCFLDELSGAPKQPCHAERQRSIPRRSRSMSMHEGGNHKGCGDRQNW